MKRKRIRYTHEEVMDMLEPKWYRVHPTRWSTVVTTDKSLARSLGDNVEQLGRMPIGNGGQLGLDRV